MGLLSAHYRQSVDWIYRTLRDVQALGVDEQVGIDTEILAALDDDLNTPKAFARLNQLAKALANASDEQEQIELKSKLLKSGDLLGVLQTIPAEWFSQDQAGADDIKAKVEQLIAAREQARADKDWGRSDAIRDELDAMGVVLEDSPTGTRWSMK